MEERTSHPIEPPPADEFIRALNARRQQAIELAEAQQQRFDRLDADLQLHLAELGECLADGLNGVDGQSSAELDQLAASLRQRADELSALQTELAAERAELASRQAELNLAREQLSRQHQENADAQRREHERLDRRAAELNALEAKVEQAQRALSVAHEEHHNELKQLAARRARLDEQHARLEKELEELESRRAETRGQRQRIAQQLKTQREAMVREREAAEADLERQRAAVQKDAERAHAQLREDREVFDQETSRVRQQLRRDRTLWEHDSAELQEARRQWEESRRKLDKSHGDQSAEIAAAHQEIARLTSVVAQSQRVVAESAGNLEEVQRERDDLKRQLSERPDAGQSESEAVGELRREHAGLTARIRELEAELGAAEQRLASARPPADAQRVEDLQRRFEMAVDDVRQLKRRNAELEEELTELQAGQPPAARIAGEHVQDWETTKRRLMAELQDDGEKFGGNLSDDERLTVEGAIRITDDIVAQRDRELAELKQQLAQEGDNAAAQSAAAKGHAAEAAAIAEVLDQDEIIQQERARVVALQQEWQEKCRQAEVEISVQRARLGRERTDLEAKLNQLEEEKKALAAQQAAGGPPAAPGTPKKPARRWLTRLGLKENDKD